MKIKNFFLTLRNEICNNVRGLWYTFGISVMTICIWMFFIPLILIAGIRDIIMKLFKSRK